MSMIDPQPLRRRGPPPRELNRGLPQEAESVVPPEAAPMIEGVWLAIEDKRAPKDGSPVFVRCGPTDTEGRMVKWKLARFFTGRRWQPGGKWVASDTMIPLRTEPTEFLYREPPPVESEEIDLERDQLDQEEG